MAIRNGKAKVYHAVWPGFHSGDNLFGQCPDGYQLVAEVETESLDDAFRLTNDVDGHWWLNAGVSARRIPCRSTSVGDVIVLPDGEPFVVLRCGFQPADMLFRRSW